MQERSTLCLFSISCIIEMPETSPATRGYSNVKVRGRVSLIGSSSRPPGLLRLLDLMVMELLPRNILQCVQRNFPLFAGI